MGSILVQLNLDNGSVIVSGSEDGELCELRLQWKSSETGGEGFYVEHNTFSVISLRTGMFVAVSELAAEIFLREYILGISHALNIVEIEYVTNNGVHLSSPAFLPSSIIKNDEIEDFIEEHASLTEIWGAYRQNGDLDIQHIDSARKCGVLYDLVSLLNLERFILLTQLENE
jgi:hypothetical protein